MTAQEPWLLPEGVDELLPPQARALERLRRALLDLFDRWGYDLVVPPLIEHLHSLLTGVGNDLDLQTFKMVDQLSGRTLGLRADIAPQIARIDARRLRRDLPARLCYVGAVLRTRPERPGGARDPIQAGAEIYGHAGVAADIEAIDLMREALQRAGVASPHLDVGHVGLFWTLAGRAQLTPEATAALFDALQRKAAAELEALAERHLRDRALRRMMVGLATLNGGAEVIEEARALLAEGGAGVCAALDALDEIARTARRRGWAGLLHFDLAELRGYRYHTGVVFAAYAPGSGQAVAQGGRYDNVGKVFGRARPATGFSVDLKQLVSLRGRASEKPCAIFAPAEEDAALHAATARLRADGERVIRALPGQRGDAAAMGCDRLLTQRGGEWVVVEAAPLQSVD